MNIYIKQKIVQKHNTHKIHSKLKTFRWWNRGTEITPNQMFDTRRA